MERGGVSKGLLPVVIPPCSILFLQEQKKMNMAKELRHFQTARR